MLECPQCGSPEVKRIKDGNVQHVLFGCMLMVALPIDQDDITLQHKLDEWKRTGKLQEWLEKPLFSEGNAVVLIKNKKVVEMAKKKFDEMWSKGKKLEETERDE